MRRKEYLLNLLRISADAERSRRIVDAETGLTREETLARDRGHAETHYILLIHGTWNPPRDGHAHWCRSENNSTNFCFRLAQHLSNSNLAGAIWRPVNGIPIFFSWSGENDHDARLNAAVKLSELMERICDLDRTARIHLIGHSHGGNVILGAIEYYLFAPARKLRSELPDYLQKIHLPKVSERGEGNSHIFARSKKNRLGRIVLMGTPFLSTYGHNLYFHDSFHFGFSRDVLAVTSRALDEILLGMACEPVAESFIVPQVRSFLGRWFFLNKPATKKRSLIRTCCAWIIFVVWRSTLYSLAWCAARITERIVMAVLRRSIRAFVSGVPAGDRRGSPNLAVKSEPPESKVLDFVTWDVTNILLSGTSEEPSHPAAETEDSQGKYDFLWNQELFDAKLATSFLWKAYTKTAKLRRWGRPLYEPESLQRACVTLEQKILDVLGAINLDHSHYYNNEKIIQAIAEFLITGRRPESETSNDGKFDPFSRDSHRA
jgi:hypothetical protein